MTTTISTRGAGRGGNSEEDLDSASGSRARTSRARGSNSRKDYARNSRARGSGAVRMLIAVGLLLMVLVQLVPFYITLTTALKPKTDLSSQWLPPMGTFTLQNVVTAVTQGNILTAIGNSAIVTVGSTVLVCLIGALAAYPLARRTTRLNAGISFGIIGLMMIPPLSTLVPLYVIMRQIGALNTHWGIILVMVAGNLPVAIFLYTAFIRGLPVSIEEAASVDGAKPFQILFKIVFPMLKPVTATVIILTSVGIWNEFALSGFFLQSPEMRTIAPTIASFFSSSGSNMNAAAAASLLSVVPVLIAYLVLQKYFIKGMIAGAGK